MIPSVPKGRQDAAEEVRAHLVALRGGAPFLSPADGALLVAWLDDGVPVSTILLALERAAAARRKRKSRLPLTLIRAKAHLGKPTRGTLAVRSGGLVPLAEAIVAVAKDDAREAELRNLAAALLELRGEQEDMTREGLSLFRAFFETAWDAMRPTTRAEFLEEARGELADLMALLDEQSFTAAVEEHARDRLRAAYPLLTAATLWDHLATG